MKIVFLSPSAQLGGAEAVLLTLLPALRDARPNWLLHVIAGEDGPLIQKVRSMNFPCEVLPFPAGVRMFGENRAAAAGRGSSPKLRLQLGRVFGWVRALSGATWYAYQLRRRLRKLRPDLIHSNGMKMHVFGALTKPNAASLVWHLHDYVSIRPTMFPLLRRLVQCCRMVIANSESVAIDARQIFPAALPVHTVHNGIDTEVFTPDGPKMDLDQAAGLPAAAIGTVRVGLVATFALWKGHEVFLRAAALVSAQHSHPVRFYVVGGPIYATAGSQRTLGELRALANELHISHQTGFTEFVTDVPSALRSLDVVVHASTEPEPFGLVIVQAMACERAVIISAAGGALELIEPECDALVHKPGDSVELALAIGRLMTERGLRTLLGRAGRAKAQRDFSRVQMADTMGFLYEHCGASS